MEETQNFWKKCNICKKPILFGAKYWVCNVSTCNRKRTGLAFCEVSCWDAHLPFARHRESWAEERRAPLVGGAEEERTSPKTEPEPKPEIEPIEPETKTTPKRAPAADTPGPAKVILRKKN